MKRMTTFISLDNILKLGDRFSNEKLWHFIKNNIDKVPIEHQKLIKTLLCVNLSYQNKKQLEEYMKEYENRMKINKFYNLKKVYPYSIKLTNEDCEKILKGEIEELNIDDLKFEENIIVMKDRFHPTPLISQWFNDKTNLTKYIYKLCEKLKQTPPSIPTNVFELYQWMNWYQGLVRNDIIISPKGKKIVDINRTRRRNGEKKKVRKVRIISKRRLNNCDKKDTYRIEYNVPKFEQRSRLFYISNISRKIARSYYYWLGKLQGRWMNYFKPAITAEGAIVDKANLFWKYIEENKNKECDIMTLIFAMHVVCNWSRRKEFTLMEQGHGGLDFTANKLFNIIKDSPNTDWKLLGHLMISEDIYKKLNIEDVTEIENKYRSQLDLYVKFLEWQWNLGVAIQAKKHMVMPRRGTTKIDTNGWNKVQGAYNKCIKALRVISKVLGIEGPKAYNCIALIANDQMGMAKNAEKNAKNVITEFLDSQGLYGSNMNKGIGGVAKVFKRMARNHMPPWIGLKKPNEWPRVFERLLKNCVDLMPDFEKRGIKTKEGALGHFIGLTNDIKLVADKSQENMICGVVIGNVSKEEKEILELFGFAGANIFGNAEPEPQLQNIDNNLNYII
jgi:hypothetical protein